MLSTKASAKRIPLLSLCHIRLHQGSIRLDAACGLFSSRLGQMCSVRVTFIYILGIVGSIALITGCVLLPLGLAQQAEASSADPSTEFASVGTCEITHVLHRAEDRQEGGGSKQHQGVCAGISTSTSLSTKGRPTSPRRSGFVAVVNAARILHKELGSSPRVRIHPAGRLLATFRVCTVSATMLV